MKTKPLSKYARLGHIRKKSHPLHHIYWETRREPTSNHIVPTDQNNATTGRAKKTEQYYQEIHPGDKEEKGKRKKRKKDNGKGKRQIGNTPGKDTSNKVKRETQ